MIVLKHVICPNIPNMKGYRYYLGKIFNHLLKPSKLETPLNHFFYPVRIRFGFRGVPL